MFAIYTPLGRTFSGPLEDLRRVDKTAKRSSLQNIDDTLEDVQVSVSNNGAAYTVSKNAASQYRELLLHNNQREPVYHAYQIMSLTVKALMAEWPLDKALQQFKRYNFQLFPIINNRRQLVGVLSRRQFYEYLLDMDTAKMSMQKTIEASFLAPQTKVYSAEPVTDVRRITTLLVEKNLDALPIVENTGRIVGIVSRTDILRCAIADPPLSLWC